MPEELKNKLKEIAPHMLEEKDLPMFLKLEEISESLAKIALKEMPEMPHMEMPEVHKVEIMGAEFLTIKGEKGETGEIGPKGDSIVGPQGPKGDRGDSIVGPAGRDGIDGESIVGPKGENGKDGSPDNAEQIVEKLNTLEEAIDIEVIKGLKKKLEDLEKKWSSRPMFGGGGFSVGAMNFHIVDEETPTGTVNGVNTDFVIANVPSPATSLKVYKDGQRMKLTTDYTVAGKTITFLSAPLTDSIITVEYRT